MSPAFLQYRASTTRSRLILLVAAILVPLAMFAAVALWEFRLTERDHYRTAAEGLAQQVSSTADAEVVRALAGLEALATAPSLVQRDLAAFHARAVALQRTRGQFIAMRDRTGQQVINSNLPFGAELPRVTDPVLLAVDRQVFETGKPAVSGLYVGPTTRRKLVLVDLPVFGEDTVAYALSMAIDPAELADILARIAPPGWILALVDRNDVIIARSREHDAFIGQRASVDFVRAGARQSGVWQGTTLEGIPVAGAYARSPLSGWRAAVAVPSAVVDAPSERLTVVLVSAAILAFVLAAALAARVAHGISSPMRQLATTASRLGRGEPVVPLQTRLREVDDVAATLAAAADQVRERETALQASEERFRAAVRAVAGVIWTNDATGRMRGEQPGWSALTGQSEAEYRGHGWAKAIHPSDAQATIDAWNEAVRDRKTFAFEHRVRRRDGVYRTFAVRAVPVLGPGGEVREWVGVHTDVTDERAAAAALTESRAELEQLNATLERRVEEAVAERDRIWRISAELMLIAAFDARIVAVNPAWSATLGWSEGELIGASFMDLVHPDDVEATRQDTARLAGGQPTLRFENRYRHHDGGYRWLSWTAVPEAGLIHAIARDITAEKEAAAALQLAEDQLRQSQKMEVVGQLTGGIAHDFNNLLTVVTGNLEMALRRVEAGSRTARNIDSALEGARRAAALTHRLLAFSRQSPLQPASVDLNAVIAGMTDLVRRTLGETIAIKTRLADELWPVQADRNQIENALLNLCVNARDAMPEGGTLTLETRNTEIDAAYWAVAGGEMRPGPYVLVTVADTGTGMPAEVKGRVFEPFFTTKPVGKGTGLGLSQVFGFMRQSGGYAAVDSEVDEGTTVCLFFPRAASAAAAETSAPLPTQPSEGQGETILVVEDEDMVREFTVSALEEAGYRVLAANAGPAGLALLEAHPEVALLFTDVVLAGPMNGRKVAEEAHRRRPGLPVLFTTGYARDLVTLGGGLDAGLNVITKPYTAAALAERLQSLLSRVPVQ